jgi:hypothetical protein
MPGFRYWLGVVGEAVTWYVWKYEREETLGDG